MEALRDLADNLRDLRKLYRLARQRDLNATQAMAFEALKADVGGRRRRPGRARRASRPARGRTTGCRPTSSTSAGEDEVRPGGDGRLYPEGRRGTSAEQERRDGGPRHQARRAGADGGRRELCGHDGLGNEFATLGRKLPAEAVHRTKRPEDRNAIAVVDRGIQT